VKWLGAWLQRPLEDRTLAELVLHRLRWALLALLVLFGITACGYVVLESYGWIDAAYMAVITLSTVGYSEVHRLDTAGRIFTMGVIVAGFGTFVYAATTLTNLFTSGEAVAHLRRSRGKRMRRDIGHHVIVVGFGLVGQAVARGVRELERPCVVMDRDPSREQSIQDAGHVAMIGDATDERDLLEAGIQRAEALVAAADTDEVNLLVTLTARALCRDLRIVSRVNGAEWLDRMTRAGADVALSPYNSYGMSLAASAVTPAVLDVHNLPLLGLGTEEVEVSDGSPLVGQTLSTVSQAHPGVLVVGLRRDNRLHRWHDLDGAIAPGDVLVALGTPVSLGEFAGHA
jgi:voltage-gated potassium channel